MDFYLINASGPFGRYFHATQGTRSTKFLINKFFNPAIFYFLYRFKVFQNANSVWLVVVVEQ